MASRLIINADDFGLTLGVNRAIAELHQAHVLTSATLMATGAAFEDAVAIARANPSLGVGCHVVLTDGQPVSPPSNIPSLLGPDGRSFRPSLFDFMQAVMRGNIREGEIEREAFAQVQKLKQAGIAVTHLDTHKHTHLLPAVARPLLRVAQRCSVGAVRNPFEPAWSSRLAPNAFVRRLQFHILSILGKGSFESLPQLSDGHVHTTDGTIGVSATGQLDASSLRKILYAIPEGTWELVCHPGYNDADLNAITTRLRETREIERDALLQEIPQAIRTVTGLELIHYGQIGQTHRDYEITMKIGITCYPTYGGSGVVATELGIELAARGHDIHFITYSQPFRLTGREANIHFHEVAVSNYPLFEHPPYDLALATRMAEVAEFYSLDLLHVHYAIPHSVSALLAKQMLAANGRNLPFITTLHGTDITLVGLDASYLPITRFGIVKSDGVTAISSHLRDRTREAFGITSEIEVIPNFVNCDVYVRNPELVATMRPRFAAANERLLVHLSNFRPVKRVQDVIKVFARVAAAMPARLMLIGDGPDRSAAEHLALQLKVQDRIHFVGKQDNVNELLPLADLMVMPSEMESFGLAALEAMACSVPSIATRVGGVPELIEDGRNGLLFDVGDVDSMAKAAISLLSDDSRLALMAKAARQTAQDQFCASRIIPLYESYYDRVIARTTI